MGIYGDAAFTDYDLEDCLFLEREIRLIAKRKKGAKRKHCASDEFQLSIKRNRIETVFSGISALMPRYTHSDSRFGC